MKTIRAMDIVMITLLGTHVLAGEGRLAIDGSATASVAGRATEPTAFAGADRVALVDELISFHGVGTSPDDEIVEYSRDFDSDGLLLVSTEFSLLSASR